jgi:hypothetical protein
MYPVAFHFHWREYIALVNGPNAIAIGYKANVGIPLSSAG